MPKLAHPKDVESAAIYALVRVYLQDPAFVEEFRQLRSRHQDAMHHFMDMPREMTMAVLDYGGPVYEGKEHLVKSWFGKDADLPVEKPPYFDEAVKYMRDIIALLDGWKLKSQRALVIMLVMGDSVLPERNEEWYARVPPEAWDRMMPWAPPLPPLKIEVSSWALIYRGRKPVMDDIAKKLEEYEKKIKETGLHEYPSAMDRHAKWWFQHYVKGKTYDQIAEMECHGNGSIIGYQRNVGSAVRAFSRTVSIYPKTAK
jgi:hypothetical protein